jgi:dUTP pyrophosphatase
MEQPTMSKYQVIVEFRALYPDAKKPEYQTEGSSGMDLHAYVPRANGRAPEALRIPSLGRLLVDTGIALAIPPGYEGQIRPRSGFALADGVSVLNSPGTIDSDYRGEVKVLLVNLGSSAVTIHTGDRIAQLVIVPVARAVLQPVEAFADTARGAAGFGSTGKN